MKFDCPNENELIKVISGDQPDPAVLSHLETCATCRDHVESISEDMKSIATGYLQRQQKMKDLEQEAKEVLSFLNPNKPEIPFPAQNSPITWPFHAGTGIILMLVFGIALSWIVSTAPLSDENANASPDDYTLAFLNSEIHNTVESPSDVPDSIGITSIWPTDVSAFSWHPKIKNRFVVGSINGEVRVVEFDDAGKFDNKDIYYGASTTVTRLSWSPDGQQLAVGEGSGAIRIWEYGKCRLLTEHKQLIRALDFSPNGRYLFSLDYSGIVLIRQVQDWEIIRRYQISANERVEPEVIKTEPFAIGARGKWTPDSNFVFVSGGDFSDLLVRLSLDGESDLVIQDHQNSRLTSQKNGIVAIDFETVSQKWLTVKPRKETIEIRDLSDPLAIQKSISVKGIKRAYFADNQLLWVERDDSIIKIDEEGEVLSELKDASLVSFSRDHRLLSVSRSQFNIQLGFYNESCQRIAAMPDTKLTNFIDADQIGDRLISLDSRKTVRLWDLQGNHLKSQNLDSIPIQMAKHPSGDLFAMVESGGKLSVIDNKLSILADSVADDDPKKLDWIDQDTIVVGYDSGRAATFKLTARIGKDWLLKQIHEHQFSFSVKGLEVVENQVIISTVKEFEHPFFWIWEPGKSPQQIPNTRKIKVNQKNWVAPRLAGFPHQIIANEKNEFLVGGHQGSSAIYRNGELRPLPLHNRYLPVHVASNGQQVITAGGDGTVYAWNSDGVMETISLNRIRVNGLEFSRDGSLLAVSENTGDMRIFSFDNQKVNLLRTLAGNSPRIRKIVWLQNGGLAAFDQSGVMKIWDQNLTLLSSKFVNGGQIYPFQMKVPNQAPQYRLANFVLKKSLGGKCEILPFRFN